MYDEWADDVTYDWMQQETMDTAAADDAGNRRADKAAAERAGTADVGEKRYTMDEFMAAFEAIKRDLDETFGEGTSRIERVLIDDVAADARNFLTQQAPWAVALEKMVSGIAIG